MLLASPLAKGAAATHTGPPQNAAADTLSASYMCRFTDSEQQRLFQAIQLYVTAFSSSNPEPDSPALGLVEDALKMPFTGTCRGVLTVSELVVVLCMCAASLQHVPGKLGSYCKCTAFALGGAPCWCALSWRGAPPADFQLQLPCCAVLPRAMPYSSALAVFTTSQKKTMLKWLDRLNGQEAAADADAAPPAQWTLLDVTGSTAEVMNDEGDTQQVRWPSATSTRTRGTDSRFGQGRPVSGVSRWAVNCVGLIDGKAGSWRCSRLVLQTGQGAVVNIVCQPACAVLKAGGRSMQPCVHAALLMSLPLSCSKLSRQVELAVCDPELVDQLRKLFESEAEVVVELGVRHGKAAITRLKQQQ